MDKDTLKKSVTQNLRCVAQSCKGGVPLSSLQNDYKALIGTAIPFIELGYKSLESFLQSIPDFVCLKKNKVGQCVVEGVADASTAHIASLISRQKTTTKVSKKSNLKKPSLSIRKYPCHESWKSTPTNSGGLCKQVSKTCINPANPKVPMPKPVNSGTCSSTSRKIISTNQNNVIYGQSNTKANPLDAGPSNSAKLFSSLFTDTEPLIKPPVPASSSQKRTEIQEKATSHDSNILNASKEIVTSSNIAEESTLSKRQLKKRRKQAMEEILKNCTTPTFLNKNQSQESDKIIEVSPSIQKLQLKELTVKNLRSVTLSCKGGVLLNNLQKDYVRFLGIPIPFKELGYETLEAFIQDIPDVINLKKNKEGQIYAEAVSDSATAHISGPVSKQKQSNVTKKASPTSKKGSVLTKYASQNTWKTTRNSVPNNPIQESKPSIPCPLENIQSPARPTAITVNELPSFYQGKPPGSVMPKETESNFVYKPSLNCFSNIRYSIKSAKFSSLLMMNFLLFGDDSYMETLKRGILAFDGFPFYEASENWKQKEILLSMLPEDTLKECLKLLCIECISDNKKELVNKLLQFLASPGNTLSNSVEKKATENVVKKECGDKTAAEFGSFDINALENLKQLQEYVHKQEFKILSEVNVNCASTSKSSNNIESVQVNQSEKLNAKPSTVKVAKKKNSNQSAQIASKTGTNVESEQFQKLQSVFSLNPNSEVWVSSTEISTDAASNSSCNSKSYYSQAYYSPALQRKKKKKKQKTAKSETNI